MWDVRCDWDLITRPTQARPLIDMFTDLRPHTCLPGRVLHILLTVFVLFLVLEPGPGTAWRHCKHQLDLIFVMIFGPKKSQGSQQLCTQRFTWWDVISANTSDFWSEVVQRPVVQWSCGPVVLWTCGTETDPHNHPLTDCYKNWCKTCLAEEWDVIVVFTSLGGHRSHWTGSFLDEILNISVTSIICFARLGVRLSGLECLYCGH